MTHEPPMDHRLPAVVSRRGLLFGAAATAGALGLTGCAGDSASGTSAGAPPGQGTELPGSPSGAPPTGTTSGAQPTGTASGAVTAPPVADSKEALARMVAGNKRFVADRSENLDEGVVRRVAVSKGQRPFATVLGCIDSRVPIELVFDQGIGDLVVSRSGGEALDHSVIGSVEYGVAELHTPLLMVLGHQRCGAIDATIKAVDANQRAADHGDIDYVVKALTPAVKAVTGRSGDRLTNAVKENVRLTVASLRRSRVIAPLERAGKVELVGAYYELDTGKVHLL